MPAEAPAGKLVAAGKNYSTAATFDEAVKITGRAKYSKKPRSGVYGLGGLSIAKNDGTLCLSAFESNTQSKELAPAVSLIPAACAIPTNEDICLISVLMSCRPCCGRKRNDIGG